MTITVFLSGHPDKAHVYFFPVRSSLEEGMTVIQGVVNRLADALTGVSTVVLLENPSCAYSARHLVGFQSDVIGSEEFERAISEASRQMSID